MYRIICDNGCHTKVAEEIHNIIENFSGQNAKDVPDFVAYNADRLGITPETFEAVAVLVFSRVCHMFSSVSPEFGQLRQACVHLEEKGDK